MNAHPLVHLRRPVVAAQQGCAPQPGGFRDQAVVSRPTRDRLLHQARNQCPILIRLENQVRICEAGGKEIAN